MSNEAVPTLIEPEWLEKRLDEPDIRILDCTVHLSYDPETGERHTESGFDDWERSHIPNSVFADLAGDFTAADPAFRYELPDAETFAEKMGSLGVGDDSRVVLYDAGENMWAARFWWMLRVFGFDRAGVLNGGWNRWCAEDRPTSTESVMYEPTTFTPEFRPELVADKEDVLNGIDDEAHSIVNVLRPEDFAGTGANKYGRRGRIPSSVNVPTVGEQAIIDPETSVFDSPDELRRRFEEAGVTESDRVTTYCGGGIAACSAALALFTFGREDVAVYDGSLAEWATDDTLPMVADEEASE